jgi:hypothetical protein
MNISYMSSNREDIFQSHNMFIHVNIYIYIYIYIYTDGYLRERLPIF